MYTRKHFRQQESYAKAFVEHEKRFKDDMGKVLQWRSALEEAGNHSGWDSREYRSESELVEEIAQETLLRLYSISANIGGEQQSTLVGIEEHVDRIVSMLCFDSVDDVRVIGIWGMGGIGKTTLAEVVQKRFSSEFESCLFVDVGNEVRRLGLHGFVQEFFGTLLKDKDVDMSNRMAVAILQRTKVFVVLDNIDDLKHLEYLVGALDVIKSRFGEGSRIILTSRDKKLLQEVADVIYKVESLNSDKALELFNRNAFRKDSSKILDFIELSKKIVRYTGGNPLALKVFGSYLHSRSIDEWGSALSELRKAPNQEVQKVLKISFDALDRVKQSIILDIGCFFKGEKRDTIEGILGEESRIGINVLVENCLVNIDDKNGEIGMHDLIQEMAWEIARQEQVELGQRSRLWNTHDSYSVLGKNKGSARIEGIFLDTSKMSKDLYLPPTVFEAMENLRIIKIDDTSLFGEEKNKLIHFDQGLQHLPDSLRYLKWNYYPLESLPPKFEPQNLVRLDMKESKLKKLWDGNVYLENLKCIDLENAVNLIELPDLGQAPKLEYLNVTSCKRLHHMPNINCNISYLYMSYSGIKEYYAPLPDSVIELWLSNLSFERVPTSIKQMTKLNRLILWGCRNLKSLPDLPFSLQHLNLYGCMSLKVISTRGCPSLKCIVADGCTSLAEFIIDEHGSQRDELPTSLLWKSWKPCLSFRYCVKLEESAKANILKIFQRIVFGLNSGRYYLDYPGNEIPKWIEHQQEGNSIVVILNFKRISLKLQSGSILLIIWNARVKTPCGITHEESGVSEVVSLEKDGVH